MEVKVAKPLAFTVGKYTVPAVVDALPIFKVVAAPNALTVVETVLKTVALAGPTKVPGRVTFPEASRLTDFSDG
jgi:hypothetical protein